MCWGSILTPPGSYLSRMSTGACLYTTFRTNTVYPTSSLAMEIKELCNHHIWMETISGNVSCTRCIEINSRWAKAHWPSSHKYRVRLDLLQQADISMGEGPWGTLIVLKWKVLLTLVLMLMKQSETFKRPVIFIADVSNNHQIHWWPWISVSPKLDETFF